MRRGSEPLEGPIKDSGNHISVEECTKRKFGRTLDAWQTIK